MSILDSIIPRARAANKQIVLAEGQDPRVVEAAVEVVRQRIARVIILATEEEISGASAEAGVSVEIAGLTVKNWLKAEESEELAEQFYRLRAHKGVTRVQAREIMRNRLYFGNMMVRAGLADGMVAGSIASTPDMLRAAFRCLGTEEGINIASSCFIMDLAQPSPAGDRVLAFADCGVNPEPNSGQLVDIAIATCETFTALTGRPPRVAFLSFSTHGSAKHPLVDKVARAAQLMRRRMEELGRADVISDGELQADAALVPDVARRKCPTSPLRGAANILIFPDIQSGNIGYKLVERLAGARAFGPILQGLTAPVNDLSRGCSSADIVGVVAITACQAAFRQ
ncbi:MAG: phosphate acetyltransferase [Verrucomicrobia bacterium]|nr:MAG: phosphate acetyltransferase [Verrucomicrobiota bacterium]